MADSNITVAGLRATGGINQIALAWNSPVDPNINGLPYLRFAVTEVWRSSTNNRAAPTLVGETSDNSLTQLNVPRGARYWYWIRPRDRSGLYGEWFPVSPTAGIVGTESNVIDALLQPNGFIRRADSTVEEWGQALSQSAVIDGETQDGVVDETFQTTFAEVFGVQAIGKFEYEHILPEIGFTPYYINKTFVSLISLTPTQMRLQAVLVQGGTGGSSTSIITGFNSIRVYWRVYGR